MILCSCNKCNKEFSTYPAEIRKGGGKYCSRECYNLSRLRPNGISNTINYCLNCNKQTSDYRYKRCISCSATYHFKGKKLSEERINKIKSNLVIKKGSECNFWRGGVSALQRLIRECQNSYDWKKDIFKRDNYTCNECFIRGGYLEAHHIRTFKDIFNSFLLEYSQFSPIEDKEVLARIAQSYKPFWDISNGITLCKDCHNKTKLGRLIK